MKYAKSYFFPSPKIQNTIFSILEIANKYNEIVHFFSLETMFLSVLGHRKSLFLHKVSSKKR